MQSDDEARLSVVVKSIECPVSASGPPTARDDAARRNRATTDTVGVLSRAKLEDGLPHCLLQ